MSLSSKYNNRKLKTQPVASSSLPRLHPNLTQYQKNFQKTSSHHDNIFKNNPLQINPQILLKKVQISLQISKRISFYNLDNKNFNKSMTNNIKSQQSSNIFSYKKLIPYQIQSRKQFIKQTGLKKQKQKILQDDNQILITPQKWLIYNCQTHQQIKGFKFKKPHDIASISKIFTFYTAFMIIKQYKLLMDKTQLLVLRSDQQINGTKIQLLSQSIVTLKDMLYAMLLNSANNAATVIANNLGCLIKAKKNNKYFSCFDVNQQNKKDNVEEFVMLMNKYVKMYQLNNTKLYNPHGMIGNVSTAIDVAKFFEQCWKIEFFRKILATKQYKIYQKCINQQGKIINLQIKLKNTNKIININNCLGGKTGQNKIGGNSFVCIYQFDNNEKYIVVVLGCIGKQQKFRDSQKLYDWLKNSISSNNVNK